MKWTVVATVDVPNLVLGQGAFEDSALGIFAANGLTELVWLAAGALLLLLALLPRVGGRKQEDDGADYDDRDKHGFSAKRVVARDEGREAIR